MKKQWFGEQLSRACYRIKEGARKRAEAGALFDEGKKKDAAPLAEQAVADVDPSTIGFVETHGTGTPLGDPIEIEALRQAFELAEAPRSGPCILGSVKSNIGHLKGGAGAAGVLKAVLALHHKTLPPSVNFHAPNPNIDFSTSPLRVNTELRAWDKNGRADAVRRAMWFEPENDRLLVWSGVIANELGNPQEAAELLMQAVNLNPGNA